MLGANIKVEFAGVVANEDIVRQYQSKKYDLFMNVSESEGIPVSIMEALSTGMPVIAPDIGGMKEIIRTGENGILLGKDWNLGEAVDAVRLIANMEQQEYNALRFRAKAFWNTFYNADNNYKNYLKKIKSL
jgi:glycosyltransferase involved in cell wall biosynthesis